MRVFDMRRFSNLRLAGLLSVAMLLLSLHSMAEPSAAGWCQIYRSVLHTIVIFILSSICPMRRD